MEVSNILTYSKYATKSAGVTVPPIINSAPATTTAIYINFNQKKVDEANRRVIDFLNEK